MAFLLLMWASVSYIRSKDRDIHFNRAVTELSSLTVSSYVILSVKNDQT